MDNIQNRSECSRCHYNFVCGYSATGFIKCPSCAHNFKHGEKINHGSRCSICSNRYCGTNNIFIKDDCPAMMSDGRFITCYTSTNELTESMRKMNKFTSPNEFRIFMQNHGDDFINTERQFIINENTCHPKTACSQGWFNLWNKSKGNWSKFI